ncbi:MAG TPA: HEAT repeat domain-containing protein, partial [Spirochaetota bacterium]
MACCLFISIPLFSQETAPDPDEVIARLFSNEKDTSRGAYDYIEKNKPVIIAQKLGDSLIAGGDSEDKETALNLLKMYPFASVKDVYVRVLGLTNSFLVKKEVITILGNTGDRAYVIPISKELESPFSVVREKAIQILRNIGDDRMFPVIVKMSEKKDPVFRVYALEALSRLYDFRLLSVVQNLLQDENKSVRILALQCTQKNNIDKLFPIIRTLALNDSNIEVRVEAINSLNKLNDTGSLSVLLKLINNDAKEIRLSTALALQHLKLKQSVYAVSEQLAIESDTHIKSILIDTLIEMRDGGGFKGFDREISNEEYLPLRVKSVYALGVIGGPRAMGFLLKALSDKEFKVRAEACSSLSIYRDRGVLNGLLGIVKEDPERYVRLAALYSIEKIRDKTSVIPLYDQYSLEKDP